ncbi:MULTISPECIES: YqzE family protein [Virgibacillus]|uniref:YqzE family protein n=2 Tax=Virgibacillus TaxID=84406 RepID=A0A024QCK5_9BACI|nr:MULTISPECIES: YqzE family protein [Virgibacillus]EQB35982.1 hypothetical protein M948_13180 [Virgibacillus sp. CM-4]MYL41846.1 YqzE family protein [Virgibacillus massiliensis]GGJ47586.1 hypothetical protein GCM10007111_07000 [Virgibacillus kapii]CDQ39676.1 hypothetical protein BN990_01988 [Virgibacillus massiliensis]
MSTNDYIKFMTEQVVTYIDLPAEEKKKRKTKRQRKSVLFGNRWLGLLPFAFRMMINKNKQAQS